MFLINVEGVIAPFMPNPKPNEKGYGHAHRQTKDVDKGIPLILPEMPYSGEKIIPEHGAVFR